ncbi:extracellular solute-binding protein [Nonomuraea sp. SMC257]|uniref:Extracellular solute-binding protein n=2 Tax=Nonomuraea montanisoli TaxID=2741721 RepID=A0A7Y6M266_9ACTN|nr:extracellular solute-binding protein [Nonomuraea montanisoli]
MRTHPIAAVAAGLAILAGLTGCGKGGSSADGEDTGKEIRFVAAKYDDDTQPYWESLIKDFEAQNPGYRVKLEIVDWEQIDAKVKTYIQTRQQPDILNYNAYSDFARDGLIYKASDVVSTQVMKDFLPKFADGAKYGGQQYGLPFLASARLFFYNRDIFRKAGIAGPPKTWDDVKLAAQKIKSAVNGVSPLGLPFGAEEAQAEFFIWAMNNGGGWVDSSGKWAINQQANVDTLRFLRELTKAGLTQPNPETTNRKDVFNLFSQGKIGMLNGAVFQRKGFIDTVDKNLAYGVAPLPGAAGATPQTLSVQDFLVAFKNGDGKNGDGRNKDAVSRFLNFFYQKDNVAGFLKTEGFLPVTRSAGDALSSDPYYKPFVESLANARFAPTDDPAWSAVAGAAKQQIGTAVADADPKTVLDKLQDAAAKND